MFSALKYYFLEPLKMRSFSQFRFRGFQKIHEATNGRFSLLYRAVTQALTSIDLSKEKTSFYDFSDAELEKINSQIEDLGWSILPFTISEADLSAIQDFLKNTPCYSNHPQEKFSLSSELKKESHFNRYLWTAEETLKNPTLTRIITDPIWSVIANRYLKGKFQLSNLQIWLDPAPSKLSTINDSHYYHYDIDNPKFLKFFIYLTDMDKDTGAHCYIQKTHKPVKDAAFAKSKRYSDQEIHDHYGIQNEKLFAAKAGTIISEDTLGFHKGSTPVRDYRAILQLQFSYFEIPDQTTINKTAIHNLSQNIKEIYNKYVI